MVVETPGLVKGEMQLEAGGGSIGGGFFQRKNGCEGERGGEGMTECLPWIQSRRLHDYYPSINAHFLSISHKEGNEILKCRCECLDGEKPFIL